MNKTKEEYDGSTKTRIFITKLKSVESADSALARVKTRFDWLSIQRSNWKEQLNTVTDSEERISLVDKDVASMEEQKSLIVHRNSLEVKRQELVAARAEEVNNYKPEDIAW